jgi:predicted N-acetyltransferase YhbS
LTKFSKGDIMEFMKVELRQEEEKDYGLVEELTREAFWNVHFPGCDEHLLVHNLRRAEEFIKQLDFVAISNHKIVGNIVYMEAKIKDVDKEYSVLTFGPISVLPEYQNNGIGSRLINHTIKLSKEMGYRAVIIYGDPEYYKKFGFKASKGYDITNGDKKYPAALLVLELYPNALDGIKGIFDEGTVYEIDEKELEEFEKRFIKKEKMVTKTQEKFLEIANKYL